MLKCFSCQIRKGERECARCSNEMICTKCCGITRSWENCPTTCLHFKEEEEPFFYYHNIGMIPETGEGTKFIENCFLPDVYELVSCNIEKLKIDFVDSHSINFSLTITLEATRNIMPEIYCKDSWKRTENWADLDTSSSIHPLIFIFGDENSTFSLSSTSIKIKNRPLNLKQSLIHWNIWMPFSKKYFEDEKLRNSYTGKIETKIFKNPQTGELQTHKLPISEGRYFSGKNLAIFSEIDLNTPIEIKTTIRFQKAHLIPKDNVIQTHFGIFLPFKIIKSKDIEINPPADFAMKRSEIEILLPGKGKKSQEIAIPVCNENARVLAIGGKESIVDPYTEFKTNDFRFLHFINKLTKFNISEHLEAVVFVTSFPIPVSIYNSINKLDLVNFSVAKVIVTNFSYIPLKVSIIAEIQGFSYSFENDLVIYPWSQSELKIVPFLFDDKIIELYSDTDANLLIKVEHDGRQILRKNTAIKLLSKNTMIWDIEDPGQSWHIRLCNLVAVWVTPDIPEIDSIISEVGELMGKIDVIKAYKYADAEVQIHVEAIYDVISRNIRYINRPINFGQSNNMFTQRITTPKETLKQKGGNCLDLSILFASCLESLGIKPLIALIPGHAFVGWKGRTDIMYFLEATYMGTKNYEESSAEGDNKYKRYFTNDKQNEVTHGFRHIVDIEKMRNLDILPIKY
jgi:hypothetical protein